MISLDNELLKAIREEFCDNFINSRNDLILIPKTNLYFRLEDVETELDLICKLLEWCSRDAYKTEPFRNDYRNQKYQDSVREHINNILRTEFTRDEMEEIYCKLGGCVNRQKTIKFIDSNYDISLLKGNE
jgi:hypothetical protein